MDSASFALMLAAFSFSINDWHQYLVYTLIALIILNAFVKLGLDFSYLAFGIGLMMIRNDITNNHWGINLFMLAGAAFIAIGISQIVAIGIEKIALHSLKGARVIAVMWIVFAVVWTILNWK